MKQLHQYMYINIYIYITSLLVQKSQCENHGMQVEETTDAGIPMNFLKTALQNRFLSVVCPKDWDIPS